MPKGQVHKYTQEQFTYLEQNKTLARKTLTEKFNAKFGTGLTKGAINSLCKRKGWLTGRTGLFNKGAVSWNAGTTGICKGSDTSFKKGSIPANVKPVGSERICSKDGVIFIKVDEPNPYTQAKTRYRHKHLVIWEKARGPIEPGMVVRFIDNDKMNCDIRNLELVTKAVNLRMNQMGYADLPIEVKPTAKAYAQLEVATFAIINKQQSL